MGLGRWINRGLDKLGYKIVRFPKNAAGSLYDQDGLTTRHNHDFLFEPRFRDAYLRGVAAVGSDYGWHWRVRVGLWAAAHAIQVDGDFVECGVNRGFLSSAILRYLDWARRDRDFYLLDTFAGIDPEQISEDERADGVLDKNAERLSSGFYTDSVEPVRKNFAEWPRVHIVQGSIPATLDRVPSPRLAYLHIDMNCAPPELAALAHFWPRVSPGGLVLFDDYAYAGFEAQKPALDAFAREQAVEILPLPTGQGLIIKPPEPAP